MRATPASAATIAEVELTSHAMGGTLTMRVACTDDETGRAMHDLERVAARIDRWAARLTRFSPTSDLASLNAAPTRARVVLRPTLAAVLGHAARMSSRTEGVVDVAMLDQRLDAETGRYRPSRPHRAWRLVYEDRHVMALRDDDVRFDLDGVAKGWIADRALALLRHYPAALVDADGDVAMRCDDDVGWRLAISRPTIDGGSEAEFASLHLPADRIAATVGIATSGTSVHRWEDAHGVRHHLLDPSSGRPALTDVVQATVVAEGAAAAECLAKAVVIRGSEAGIPLAERGGAWGMVLILESGAVISTAYRERRAA